MAISIDFGSKNTVVVLGDQTKILATALAVEEYTGDIVAFGDDAEAMRERTPPRVQIVNPVARGVVTDLEGARRYLQLVWSEIGRWSRLRPGKARMVSATNLGRLEKNVLLEALSGAGGGLPELAWNSLASAATTGRDIESPEAIAVVNLGAETTELAVFSAGRLLRSSMLSSGGEDLTRSIQRGASEDHGVDISWEVAESLKRDLGSACADTAVVRPKKVTARDRASGLPVELEVSTTELSRWTLSHLERLRAELKSTFSGLPPEVASDLYQHGIILTGGGALLPDMERFVSDAVGVKAVLTDQPLLASALGARSISAIKGT